jgi:SAM-dependent methyltransferase
MRTSAIWHEVECGGYSADLEAWEMLAASAAGPLLELGCGTGRVALHLARRGHAIWALDADPALLEALEAQASREGLSVRAACADVRTFALERTFDMILAPMQLLQMLDGEASRRSALERAAAHLAGSGRLAAAIVERPAADLTRTAAALPDVRERGGWVYSSLPTISPSGNGDLEIRRLRQAVSPDGAMLTEEHLDRLLALDADELDAEGEAAGLCPADRVVVPATDGYLGATVVVLRRA